MALDNPYLLENLQQANSLADQLLDGIMEVSIEVLREDPDQWDEVQLATFKVLMAKLEESPASLAGILSALIMKFVKVELDADLTESDI